MPDLWDALTLSLEVRSLIGLFLSPRGDIEKLKQLSRKGSQILSEAQYPIVGENSEIIGTVTYIGSGVRGASSSSH